jgi:hypothetical protein
MTQTNFETAVEVIGQAIHDCMGLSSSNPEEMLTIKAINNLLDCAEKGYVLIEWPESQLYMEEEWFEEEAILALGSEDKTGSSAYFIPIKRLI